MSGLITSLLSFIYGGIYPAVLIFYKQTQAGNVWSKGRTQHETGQEVDLLCACASLGEFETIRYVLSQLKDKMPTLKIEVAFFSKSGYDYLVLSSPSFIDTVSLLPFDRPSSLKTFIASRSPKKVLLSTLNLWPVFLSEICRQEIPFSVAHVHMKSGLLKSFYYRFFSKYLDRAQHLFCYDKDSENIAKKYFTGPVISQNGDPRIDSIIQELDKGFEGYKNTPICNIKKDLFIFASIHEVEINQVVNLGKDLVKEEWCVLIAPHHLSEVSKLSKALPEAQILTDIKMAISGNIILLKTMGDLKHLYQHARAAYVGGGFDGKSHNLLEPLLSKCITFTGHKNDFELGHYFARNFFEIQELALMPKVIQDQLGEIQDKKWSDSIQDDEIIGSSQAIIDALIPYLAIKKSQ